MRDKLRGSGCLKKNEQGSKDRLLRERKREREKECERERSDGEVAEREEWKKVWEEKYCSQCSISLTCFYCVVK